MTLLCNQEYCCHVAEQDVEYVVDLAASYHCLPKSEYFSTYKARDYGKVKMGNKSVSQIAGIGDICIQTSMGCTRKTWGFLFHTKSRVFQYFHKFHVMVERETENPLKNLRTDNGKEYISRKFKEYYSKHGIRHEKMVPATPQHNRIAEKMN